MARVFSNGVLALGAGRTCTSRFERMIYLKHALRCSNRWDNAVPERKQQNWSVIVNEAASDQSTRTTQCTFHG